MKTKIIELKQEPVVLIELPKRSPIEMSKNGLALYCPGAIYFNKPMGIMGYLSDPTEEQFAECVNVYEVSESINIPKMRFYQMLESENVYTENPYEKPNTREYSAKDLENDNSKYWKRFDGWQKAQSRTIDPKRTVVLIRKED